MKQLIIILATFVSCNDQRSGQQHEDKATNDNKNTVATVRLNSGKKWKADEATKRNVGAIMQLMSDSVYKDAGKRTQLYTNLQAKIDTMVKECSMKGAEHDALHMWLEKVLKDLQELKDEDDEFSEVHAALTKHVADFYQSFQ